MKKVLNLLLCSLMILVIASCKENEEIPVYSLTVNLSYPENTSPLEGVVVTVKSAVGTTLEMKTDAQGKAVCSVNPGVYEVSATDKQSNAGYAYILNGQKSGINVIDQDMTVDVEMVAAKTGQIIIKELYFGGCLKNDGSGAYQNDNYVILYNNSGLPASIDNLCFGMVPPFNSDATNSNYNDNGKLTYDGEGFTPATYGIWHMQGTLTLEPYSQVVIAINGAIDHTTTYTNSVNLANKDYYAFYDPEDWSLASYYPAPYEGIPTSHYILAEKFGMGTAWPMSRICPAFFIFTTEGTTPQAFASAADYWYDGGKVGTTTTCLKVKNDWILDAVDVFSTRSSKNPNQKRFTSDIDAGSVLFTYKLGYTIYRCVDVEATNAIEGNASLLVKGLPSAADEAAGVVTCDPSGINAEASAKAGAKIIFKDTNNSSNDFFERYQSSLRD